MIDIATDGASEKCLSAGRSCTNGITLRFMSSIKLHANCLPTLACQCHAVRLSRLDTIGVKDFRLGGANVRQ